jgi:NTP pyrophosphatase (non-canonical NTP hydrolase)
MIKDIVARQIESQKTRNSNFETMYLAFVEELGELVASFGYCDWKPVERDEANILIELVDLAIFAINMAYYREEVEEPIKLVVPRTDFELVQRLVIYLAEGRYNELYYCIFKAQPFTQDVVTAKQALNKLRQNYGYGEGKYQKMWTEDKEDNYYLSAVYGKSYEEAYNVLETVYVNQVLKGLLINVFDD